MILVGTERLEIKIWFMFTNELFLGYYFLCALGWDAGCLVVSTVFAEPV